MEDHYYLMVRKGIDDVDLCGFITPALTTMHAPAYEMGQYGANFLVAASNLLHQETYDRNSDPAAGTENNRLSTGFYQLDDITV